ncbi:hypothetical protein [Intrasporangium sp.]|uniref:hypothetical protein n=1 Tax=Intrasporangium sp. TaxID=1925024 RepID=UPI002649224C|nr:hypothetical protein [Intrasporangium sp.]
MTPPRPVRGEPVGTQVNTAYPDEPILAPEAPTVVPDEPTVRTPENEPPGAA